MGVHAWIESLFGRFAEAIYVHRLVALAATLALALGLASQAGRLEIDTRDESFFHENDTALVAYNEFRDVFGQDDVFLIALEPENGFTTDFLSTLFRFHRRLEKAVPWLDEVSSLVNGRVVRAEGDTLFVEDLMETPPQSQSGVQELMERIDRYPLYENLLVSTDKTMALIAVRARAELAPADEDIMAGFEDGISDEAIDGRSYLSNRQNVEINEAIKKTVAEFEGEGIRFHLTGTPAFVAEIQKGIERDMACMTPLSLAMTVLFLCVFFRRATGVIYPLVVVVFSVVSTFGFMAVSGMPVTNATVILPTFLMVVGIADSVHIMAIFYENRKAGLAKRQAIVDALRFAGLPILMTSITTAAGLFSFVWADVAIVSQLGIAAPVGVMLAFLYSIVLLPALIALFPAKEIARNDTGNVSRTDRLFLGIARWTAKRPWSIVAVSMAVAATAGYLSLSLKFSHNSLAWFPEDFPVRVDTEVVDRKIGGSAVLEVVLDTGRENGLHDPEFQRRLSRTAEEILRVESQGVKGAKAWSIADVLKETNRALNEDREDAYAVPDDEYLIAQELLLFESSGSDDLEDFTESTYRKARFSILAPFADAMAYKKYLDEVVEFMNKRFPEADVSVTGHIPLMVRIIEHFTTSMAKSYLFALAAVTLPIIFIVGRVRIGILSMAGNLAPVLLTFGLMGATGIPIDMSTVLIGSILLGLVVDDSIHFLHHFRAAYEETGDVENSVASTLRTTGRALALTSFVLCAGFFVFTLSFLKSNIRFGLLSGFTVLFALVADFVLLPALLAVVHRKNTDMRGSKKSGVVFVLVFVTVAIFFAPDAFAGDLSTTPKSIMEKVDARDDGDRFVSDMDMILIDRRGKKRHRKIRSFGMDQGKDRLSLMFFVSPGDVKGTGFLSFDYRESDKDDDQWPYLPALKKTKRIVASDKSGSFMGSDFSYSDLTKIKIDDYRFSFYEKYREVEIHGEKCWAITSLPKSPEVVEETGYVESVLFVLKKIQGVHFFMGKSLFFW